MIHRAGVGMAPRDQQFMIPKRQQSIIPRGQQCVIPMRWKGYDILFMLLMGQQSMVPRL